jgi:hypothetical protein
MSSVLWVVQSSSTAPFGLGVDHYSGSRASGFSEGDAWTEPVSAVRQLDSASVLGETSISAGSGTSTPRGWINLSLSADDTVDLSRSDTGQPNDYRFQVVNWPLGAVPAVTP